MPFATTSSACIETFETVVWSVPDAPPGSASPCTLKRAEPP